MDSLEAMYVPTERERIFYRNLLRTSRYSALEDSENFRLICFAIEALGLKLMGEVQNLGKYEKYIHHCIKDTLYEFDHPQTYLRRFADLYKIVRLARNDNMHGGAYARHATVAAIELCNLIEIGLINKCMPNVGSLMISSPTTVEIWQPIARIRQLMLINSFSYIPFYHNENWFLISELNLAMFLRQGNGIKKQLLGLSLSDAIEFNSPLELVPINNKNTLTPDTSIEELIDKIRTDSKQNLWLVTENTSTKHLIGIISPSELL